MRLRKMMACEEVGVRLLLLLHLSWRRRGGGGGDGGRMDAGEAESWRGGEKRLLSLLDTWCMQP